MIIKHVWFAIKILSCVNYSFSHLVKSHSFSLVKTILLSVCVLIIQLRTTLSKIEWLLPIDKSILVESLALLKPTISDLNSLFKLLILTFNICFLWVIRIVNYSFCSFSSFCGFSWRNGDETSGDIAILCLGQIIFKEIITLLIALFVNTFVYWVIDINLFNYCLNIYIIILLFIVFI